MTKAAAVAGWLALWREDKKNYTAFLEVKQVAELLGVAEHEVSTLMTLGSLVPLGDPAPNAPKYFAATKIIELAKVVIVHWRGCLNGGEERFKYPCEPAPSEGASRTPPGDSGLGARHRGDAGGRTPTAGWVISRLDQQVAP